MKLPKTYFQNLSAAKYREYLKLLPDIHKEHVQLITMLIFTFAALSFFGVFAINPTLSTIVELRKQLADRQSVHKQLQTKIQNLSLLQQQYSQMGEEIPFVLEAIPEQPAAPLLSGQVQALLQQSNLKTIGFRVAEVRLADQKKSLISVGSFIFTLEITGDYEDMMNFVASLTNMNRIVTIESLAIARNTTDNKLTLNIRGRQYFKP